ncbi:MAG: ribosome biogenesis GTP-binding protein YihA/YsxC [Vicinamibacterales bacterium]|nr:ribosome biogenesis GTP-binding protein YsxC [Acidobacteriota bacterium]MDP6374203.1 ribosome biogenesis GTP-binding protein YihA/YsxC [Vicinamibacterales bacterium]MDP6608656.1 ribosome biogenesis GTP-binding protein YihA/YsxC [Vicinamibacterales bacterium]HAK56230.1 ribosome biogenesis GTP-binding protein YsxC [Acidobacteriota bacterium]
MKILETDLVSRAAGDPTRAATTEIALVGRSNVGKSSLINALIRRKLARTSRAPGKTDRVNVYRVRLAIAANRIETINLIDLPGYGYARGGAKRAEAFAEVTGAYFAAQAEPRDAERPAPRVLHLVDTRHPELDVDRDAHRWLADRGLAVLTVGTKADTLPRAERTRVAHLLEASTGGAVLLVSAKSGDGLKELWRAIVSDAAR